MEQNTKHLNIYQKLSLITGELTAIAKNLNVNIGQASYKAVGEADVLAAIKPLEIKHGIYSYPAEREIVESKIIESEKVDKYTKQKVITKSFFERIKTIYRFVNIDNVSEYIEITSYGDGIDTQDKSVGKAMTYADKYALLKAYKIITGEDPDQYGSGVYQEQYKPQNESQKAPYSASYNPQPTNTQYQPKNQKMTDFQRQVISGLPANLKQYACETIGVASIEEFTEVQAQQFIDFLVSKKLIEKPVKPLEIVEEGYVI